jgi:uncharacterized protein (TIGR02246 family)
MRKATTVIGVLALVLIVAQTVAGQETSGEIKALDQSLEAWVTAFNKHDAKLLAAQYAKDADLVNPVGERWAGREEIEKGFAAFFRDNPNVRIKITVTSRRFVRPDVVLEDGTWEEQGHTEKGLPPKGVYTALLVKEQGKWISMCDRSFVLAANTDAKK